MSAFERVIAGSRGLNVWDDAFNEMFLYSARKSGPVGASFGHSMTTADFNGSDYANPGNNNPSNRLRGMHGHVAWCNFLSHQRTTVPHNFIRGYPSQDVSVGATLIKDFLDYCGPISFIHLDWLTNDVLHNIGYQVAVDAYWSMIQTCLDKNVRPIVYPIIGRTIAGTPLTLAQYGLLDKFNYWIEQLPDKTRGMVGVPRFLRRFNDFTKIGAQPKAGLTYDGTHPNCGGAFLKGEAASVIISSWFPTVGRLATSNLTYDSVNAPNANMIRNPMFQTSTAFGAGTLSNATGVAPDAWTVSRVGDAGITVASSLVTDAEGGSAVQLVLGGSYTVPASPTPGNSNGGRIFANFVTGAGTNPGDVIETLIGVELDAGHTGIQGPSLQHRWNSSIGYNQDMIISYDGGIPAGKAVSGTLRTYPHEVAASGETLGQLLAWMNTISTPAGAVTVSATCRFQSPVARKIN